MSSYTGPCYNRNVMIYDRIIWSLLWAYTMYAMIQRGEKLRYQCVPCLDHWELASCCFDHFISNIMKVCCLFRIWKWKWKLCFVLLIHIARHPLKAHTPVRLYRRHFLKENHCILILTFTEVPKGPIESFRRYIINFSSWPCWQGKKQSERFQDWSEAATRTLVKYKDRVKIRVRKFNSGPVHCKTNYN